MPAVNENGNELLLGLFQYNMLAVAASIVTVHHIAVQS